MQEQNKKKGVWIKEDKILLCSYYFLNLFNIGKLGNKIMTTQTCRYTFFIFIPWILINEYLLLYQYMNK